MKKPPGTSIDMERWLRSIKKSTADSLLEAFEEVLTIDLLNPGLLKTLHSTNPEMFFDQQK